MAEKTKTTKEQYEELTSLIDTVKKDNLAQFGEIKKEFGAFSKVQDKHENEINKLKEDKIKRDAVAEFKKQNPGGENTSGTLALNKELLKAVGLLLGVITVIATLYMGLK